MSIGHEETPLDAARRMRRTIDALTVERDEAAAKCAQYEATLRELSRCRCDAAWTSRGLHATACLSQDGLLEETGYLDAALKDAFRRGADAMRASAVKAMRHTHRPPKEVQPSDSIAALPLPEGK